MKAQLIIIDDFYSDPDDVVSWAKTLEFTRGNGNHPGWRTLQVTENIGVKNYIQNLIRPFGGEITMWDWHPNGTFSKTNVSDINWVHSDCHNTWAGVVYLTKDAPLNSGTSIFKHKPTGLISSPRLENGELNEELLTTIHKDGQDKTKWEPIEVTSNVYNRLVMYRGDLFHTATNYFGSDYENDCRFFQTFFFNTEF
jgi:hypothetical protein|tara:strand:- start:66 stop:656 length:591 start_codon:yes stop_codon:yes gene_type:complete